MRKGSKMSAESREKMRITSTKKWQDPIFRANQKEGMLKACAKTEWIENNSMRGKKLWQDPEYREKVTRNSAVAQRLPENREKKSAAAKIRCNTPEYKADCSRRLSGPGNPRWKDGRSFESYALSFTSELRRAIRKRDEHKCQLCNKSQKELKWTLSVHHIDYDKLNSSKENLVSLCINCHLKIHGQIHHQEHWITYFQEIMGRKYATGL